LPVGLLHPHVELVGFTEAAEETKRASFALHLPLAGLVQTDRIDSCGYIVEALRYHIESGVARSVRQTPHPRTEPLRGSVRVLNPLERSPAEVVVR
jgi:hypothetical protein